MKKNQLPEIIKGIGLSEKGTTIYCALLELGGAFPSEIAKTTKLKRSTVYEVLNDLAIKGLVSELMKRNKYYYTIENPKRLLHFSERKLAQAENENQKLKELLPELQGLYVGLNNKPKVSYFEGVDSVMEIYNDHLLIKKHYEMTGFVNVAELMSFLPKEKYQKYAKEKENLGITTRGIIPDTANDRAYEKTIYSELKRKTMPIVRYIPKEDFPWKGDITIYAENKVSIVSFDGRQPIGMVIESETIHRMMQMIFNLAWKGAAL